MIIYFVRHILGETRQTLYNEPEYNCAIADLVCCPSVHGDVSVEMFHCLTIFVVNLMVKCV